MDLVPIGDVLLHPVGRLDLDSEGLVILTTDGRVLSGLLDSQTDEGVVLRTAERKILRLPQPQIEQMQKSPKSLMPDQILSDLTAQEAADLLEYVRSLGAAP